MKQLTQSEYVTALFVIAMYHWYINDKLNANSALEVALQAAKLSTLADA